ncbi:MAG: bifunctional diaminohydroxyphosphoribosylaminopyrimidine deaminase/5-amino-6-(5-phosphoribosylamino)uracil reductase RibD [Pirellulaceae bacterium]|nr:bifunctional diaminohydroxyphosphoribosylaminopyrimidine deaminase/5-amino-6-(5-phosphoribosylamino)uracil reductase RibD [Pirellulaceae bacterium]
MRRALELAAQGLGYVEPNPLVGCVIARGGQVLGEGWHQRFGGPHAEVEALRQSGPNVRGATAYVTLEPCCHHGKTPPCTDALLQAGIARVVVAQVDPFAQVAGQGIQRLREAGVAVEVGLLQARAEAQLAAYRKRVLTGLPWVIAKWAMTLDGRIASRTGHSQWISGVRSRQAAHELRGRVDAIVVGSGTLLADNPSLTARPPGPRTATRVVLDSRCRTPVDCQLVRSANDAPVLLVCGPGCDPQRRQMLADSGCEVLVASGSTHQERWRELLRLLGGRQMTHVLVEGGSQVLGSLLDADQIDEVHVFVAPRLLGGASALSPVAGLGFARLDDAPGLTDVRYESLDGDLHVWGRVERQAASN